MLNLKFDRRKNKSLPQQLFEAIKREITLHHLSTHSKLENIKVFANQYQISEEETKWIYNELINEQLVVLKDGDYYFTDFEIPSVFFDNVHSILNIIENNNYKASFKDLKFEVIDSLEEINHNFFGPALHIERIFYGDGRPVLLANFYYLLKNFPGLEKQDVKDKKVWDILRNQYQAVPKHVKMNFYVTKLNNEQKVLLETDFDYAHNIKSMIKNKDEILLEYSEIYLKIDEISFRFDIEI